MMGETCIGDPDQLASLLEKASLEDNDREHRFVPAGEVVYREGTVPREEETAVDCCR